MIKPLESPIKLEEDKEEVKEVSSPRLETPKV